MKPVSPSHLETSDEYTYLGLLRAALDIGAHQRERESAAVALQHRPLWVVRRFSLHHDWGGRGWVPPGGAPRQALPLLPFLKCVTRVSCNHLTKNRSFLETKLFKFSCGLTFDQQGPHRNSSSEFSQSLKAFVSGLVVFVRGSLKCVRGQNTWDVGSSPVGVLLFTNSHGLVPTFKGKPLGLPVSFCHGHHSKYSLSGGQNESRLGKHGNIPYTSTSRRTSP